MHCEHKLPPKRVWRVGKKEFFAGSGLRATDLTGVPLGFEQRHCRA